MKNYDRNLTDSILRKRDEIIEVQEDPNRAISSTNHANLTTSKNPDMKDSQVKTLAKLYLEGKPAEISVTTIAELCDWLWSEFQTTPLNLEFSWFDRYNNVAEMFTDIQQSHLWVSAENYNTTLDLNPIYSFIFQAVHDNDHFQTQSDFSLAGELVTYNATAKRVPSLDIQKIIYSECVLRSAAQLFLGHPPMFKIVFA